MFFGSKNNTQKGTILVLVLAVLALLSLLATTMASIQSVSRQESARYVETIEAKMLAHMGFERAIAELKRNPTSRELFIQGNGINFVYKGDESELGRQETVREMESIPPKTIKVNSGDDITEMSVSGFSSKGTYIEEGNNYSLKVNDLQGRIYVNDGVNSYGGNNSSVSQNLKRILNILIAHPMLFGEEPKMIEKLTDPKQPVGNILIDSRPPQGYRNIYEVLRALQNQYGEKEGKEIFARLEPHITTFAWVDDNVVNPVPLSHVMYDQYPIAYYRKGEPSDVGISPAVNVQAGNKPYIDTENVPEGMTSGVMLFRRGRGKNSNNEYMFSKEPLRWFDSTIGDDTHNAIYALDELFPQYIEVTSRAPVNVNTATEAVLSALLTDISGFFIMERRRYAPYSPSPKDFTVDTIAKFQDTELSHTATIRQKYQSWEYSSYSYDSKGYTMFNGTEVKEDGDEFGYIYRTEPITNSQQGTGTMDTNTISATELARHIIAAREQGEYNGISYSELPFTRFDKWSNMHRFFDYLVEKQIIKDTRSIYWNYLPQGWENIDSADWSTNIRYPPDLSEPTQQTYASYAIADALKANFNPNCHLNELNPDRNLYLRVDKTDLIVNSTEFCFTPMGYFEVESLGRILRPLEGSKPKFQGTKEPTTEGSNKTVFDTVCEVVASSKVKAVVKVFDVYRETTQAQFLRGEISNKQGPEPTNSGKGLEIGPSPLAEQTREKGNNSKFGMEWDGYIQLSTLGGIDQVNSGSGELSTPSGSPHWPTEDIAQYEGLHVHFQFDKKAHHHASATQLGDQYRDEVSDITLSSPKIIGKIDPALFNPEALVILGYKDKYIDEDKKAAYEAHGVEYEGEKGGYIIDEYLKGRKLRYDLSNYGKIERAENFLDDDKKIADSVQNYRNQLASSFRLGIQDNRIVGGEGVSGRINNLLLPYSPADLRLDGAYVERNAGLAYWIDEGVSMFSYGGAISMWIKPSFRPEATGKTRKLFSYDRWHKSNYAYRNPNMFSLLFVPAHSTPPLDGLGSKFHDPRYVGTRTTNKENRPTEMSSDGRGIKALNPASLFAGINMYQATGSLEDWEYDEWKLRDLIWDKLGTHNIDLEVFYNTPTLNSAGSAERKNDSNFELRDPKFALDRGRWTHVVWSWLISHNRLYYVGDNQSNKSDTVDSSGGSGAKGGGNISVKKLPDFLNPWGSDINGNKTANLSYEFIPIETYEHRMNIYVNGEEHAGGIRLSNTTEGFFQIGGRKPVFSLHSFEDVEESGSWLTNTIRIGESSTHGSSQFESLNANFEADKAWSRNFSGDFTVDEFALYGSDEETDAARQSSVETIRSSLKSVYSKGRYYVPRANGDTSDCKLLSGAIYLNNAGARRQMVSVRDDDNPRSKGGKLKLLGASWTWYPEELDEETSEPVMRNYNGAEDAVPLRQGIEGETSDGAMVRVGISVYDKNGGIKGAVPSSGNFRDSGYSAAVNHGRKKKNNELSKGDYIRYNIEFVIKEATPGLTTLLFAPVFDDITIFYTLGATILFYDATDM